MPRVRSPLLGAPSASNARTKTVPRLIAELEAQFTESAKLEANIRRSLSQFDFNP